MQITGNGWLLPALLVSWVGVVGSQTVKVSIDVKPGDSPTTIEPGREGMLPVAILSTAGFDATTVDPTTIRIGPAGSEAEPVRTMSDDVNKDGRSDLMMLVRIQDMKVKCGDKIIRLTGKTMNGTAIEGSEAVTTSGC
ncbi:MAG: hypothetical protein WD690_01105 [Vicinamibacterales bacterium]